MSIQPSELILNKRGAVYHLDLKPEELADTILLVGDPGRVKQVSKYFDKIEFKKENREFITHTGIFNNKKISVISSGIGTDNIDIVMNELDALANINLQTGKIHKKKKSLKIIRIGTCGALQKEIPVDSFVVSEQAIGLDGILYYYKNKKIDLSKISNSLAKHCKWNKKLPHPYTVKGNKQLIKLLAEGNITGTTLTAIGFYGPQGRKLRMKIGDEKFIQRINSFKYKSISISNFEMETSAIYALGKIMGHKTCTICCVVANRINGAFSLNYPFYVDKLIQQCLTRLTQ